MRIFAAIAATLICAPLVAQSPIPIRVDATDAARRLFHVQMTMPAKPGPMTLMYPEWIPGEHGPTGPDHQYGRPGDQSRQPDRDLEARRRQHVRVSRNRSGGRIVAQYRFRFHLAAGILGLLFGRFRHHGTGRGQLESAIALPRRRRLRMRRNIRPICASPMPGSMERPCPSSANRATTSSFSPPPSPP